MRAGRRLLLPLLLLAALSPAAAREPMRIGWTAWADGVFVTRLAARLIEEELDQPVELVRSSIAEQYQGIASGRLDAMLMSWQPRTHAPYLARVGPRVEDLGILYEGARLGWAVPDYVPKKQVASIADLAAADVRERLDARITGIDPGSGLMRLSHYALARYRLAAYELEAGSGPAMTAALEQAIERGDWIVVTAWSPHWLFAAHDMRYLADPEGVLGGSEQVHALGRPGLHADHPAVAAMLSRMWLPLSDLQHALLEARNQSRAGAVERYIERHPRRVRYWLTGRL